MLRFCSKRLTKSAFKCVQLGIYGAWKTKHDNSSIFVHVCNEIYQRTNRPCILYHFLHPLFLFKNLKSESLWWKWPISEKRKKVKVSSERPINNLALHFSWPPLLELEFLEFCNFNFFSKKAIYQRRHLWNLGNCKNMFQNIPCIHKDYYEYVEFVDNEECCKQQWWEQQQKE